MAAPVPVPVFAASRPSGVPGVTLDVSSARLLLAPSATQTGHGNRSGRIDAIGSGHWSRIAISSSLCAAAATSALRQRHRLRRRVQAKAHISLCKAEDAPDSMRRRFEAMIAEQQDIICKRFEELDGKGKFCTDEYTRPTGGGGIARVMKNGNVFEKAGVALSVVYGSMDAAKLKGLAATGAQAGGISAQAKSKEAFFACGLSCVMHPRNPFCPTMHFNYRYFETESGKWWFAGGTDITPSYLDVEDMGHFHGTYKRICDSYNPEWYPRFKKWADDYFVIKHRGETRGLGGIFFDEMNSDAPDKHFAFSTECLKAVQGAYIPMLEKNRNKEYTEKQKQWQQIRRGRYAEYNFVYDRGTIFGLKILDSGIARIETILMSLPETARYEYCHEILPGSPEADITDAFMRPREWA